MTTTTKRTRNYHTDVSILDVRTRLAVFRFDNVIGLLGHVSNEHLLKNHMSLIASPAGTIRAEIERARTVAMVMANAAFFEHA